MSRSWALFVVLAAIAFAPTAAAAGAESVTSAKPFAHSVRPRGIAEECVTLAAGQSIAYTYEASAAVDFNIHFHRGNDVEYPVRSDQVQRGEDRFTAPSAEDYCLMWTNRTLQMVTVRGRLTP